MNEKKLEQIYFRTNVTYLKQIDEVIKKFQFHPSSYW